MQWLHQEKGKYSIRIAFVQRLCTCIVTTLSNNSDKTYVVYTLSTYLFSYLYRLKMLEDFAGATEFEDKRVKLHKYLKDSEEMLDTTNERLHEFDDIMEELAKQKKKSQKYIELDKRRRAITHLLLLREREKIEEKLTEYKYVNNS